MDGAIHRQAGPGLLAECRTLGGCATGQAKITRGYGLPAQWVIHTVGPVWQGGGHDEDRLLAECYLNSLALAVERGLRTIAFPSISTGAYGFPLDRAARIAVTQVRHFLAVHLSALDRVVFVCFGRRAYECYRSAVEGGVEA